MKKIFNSKILIMVLGLVVMGITTNSFLNRIDNSIYEYDDVVIPETDTTEEFEFPEQKELPPLKTEVLPDEPLETKQLPVETRPVSIELPLQGELLTEHSYGELVYNKTMEDWRTHNGIDIASDVGTAIKAAADGTVVFVGLDGLSGYTVVVEHDGFKTKYCGMQESDIVTVNTKVSAGDVIGGVGITMETEAASSPHLHFELLIDDKSVNPLEFVENIML